MVRKNAAKPPKGAPPPKRISKSPKNKPKAPQNHQQSEEDVELDENNPHSEGSMEDEGSGAASSDDSGSDDDSGSGSGDQSDEQSSSSVPAVKPENMAVRQMQFRERRGTKMTALINRKKDEEEDSFWAEHKGLFGDLDAPDDEEEEDYVQSSSGRDQFDSDFGQTESEPENVDEDDKKIDEEDEEKEKEKKRRAELMKKVNTSKVVEKKDSVVKKSRPEPKEEPTNRYIHQMFTQEELLGEAAHTEYINWVSLKKLISIETEKKDFTRKEKHVEGSKVIFRDRLGEDGKRIVTYELDGVRVGSVADLTAFWEAK